MKKKIVSMLMCLAMTVGVLSGCGNASEPAESTAGSATVGSVTTNSSETTGDNKLTMFLDDAATQSIIWMRQKKQPDLILKLLPCLQIPQIEQLNS